jgi:hypothetical protein
MDLESITLFFAKKNFGAIEIQTEINRVLGADNITSSTIPSYLRKRGLHESRSDPFQRPKLKVLVRLTK